jgi:mono/diheme cytochrome c family protein
MTTGILALLLAALLQTNAPAGNAEAGKKAWQMTGGGLGPNQPPGKLWCGNCHGMNGEGGFGPDLAGRGLSFAQFRRAVRQPWGIMPRYPEEHMSEQAIADVYAWLSALPKVAEPAAWKTPAPAPAPRGPYLLTVTGCYQCHGAGMNNPRRIVGGDFGEAFDAELFTKVIYNHHEYYPQNQMGLFNPARVQVSTLNEIYQHLFKELGIRVPVSAALEGGQASGGNTTYTLAVTNDGVKGKGLTAGDLTVALALPAGAKVVTTTGDSYAGVKRDPKINGGADAAVWTLPALAPGERRTYTVTLAGQGTPAAAFKGSIVTWQKPALGERAPSRADSVNVAIPQPAR